MFKLTGSIVTIKETEQVTEKFSKREFVIEDASSMYPQMILFQAAQDKCAMLDNFAEGETVEVSFNLRGREWTNPKPKKGEDPVRYFNTLDAWRIESVSNNADGTESSTPSEKQTESDDVPF